MPRAGPKSLMWWIAVLSILGLILRLATILLIVDYRKALFEYMLIAQNLLNGDGFSWNDFGFMPLQPTSLFPPLYVYWCAFFMWLSPGNFLPVYISQTFVSASGVVLAYLVGARVFNPPTGVIFAGLYAIYPEMVFLPARPVPEFIYVVLCLWIIYLYRVLLNVETGPRAVIRTLVIAGLLGGVAILLKEGSAVLIVAVLLALLIQKQRAPSLRTSHLLLMILVTIIIVTPWIVRNGLVQGRFIPVRRGFGLNLWIGNHEGATGTGYTRDGNYVGRSLSPEYDAYMQQALPKDEQDRDDFYGHEAMRFIRTHPLEYLALCAKRLWYFVWFVPGHPLAENTVYRISWIVLLFIAIPSIILAVRRKQFDPVIAMMIAGYLILYIPVMVMPRYRIIPVLLLLLLASYGLAHFWDRWKAERVMAMAKAKDAASNF